MGLLVGVVGGGFLVWLWVVSLYLTCCHSSTTLQLRPTLGLYWRL